jgi:hypothetical protein
MKKLIVIVVVLLVASMAFGQRATRDSKLGVHDVTSSGALLGCQSCHIPHNALGGEYIFKYALPTITAPDGSTLSTTDANAFHSLACMSCHDGATATDITMPAGTKNFGADLSATHNHPVHETYSQRGATFNGNFVAFRNDGVTQTGTTPPTKGQAGFNYGYVECGTCHDPHKGDANTYKFLRGPSATSPAYDTAANYLIAKPTGNSYYAGYGYTYTATNRDWARLGLCRDCHGK